MYLGCFWRCWNVFSSLSILIISNVNYGLFHFTKPNGTPRFVNQGLINPWLILYPVLICNILFLTGTPCGRGTGGAAERRQLCGRWDRWRLQSHQPDGRRMGITNYHRRLGVKHTHRYNIYICVCACIVNARLDMYKCKIAYTYTYLFTSIDSYIYIHII